MNKRIQNITIGMIDGLTIPYALAAGLSAVLADASIVFLACVGATVAGAITMSIGGYTQARKYEPAEQPIQSALLIGMGYIAGGILVFLPYIIHHSPIQALMTTSAIVMPALFLCGFGESVIHAKSGWAGGLRTMVTGAVAAAAAYLIAGLFK